MGASGNSQFGATHKFQQQSGNRAPLQRYGVTGPSSRVRHIHVYPFIHKSEIAAVL